MSGSAQGYDRAHSLKCELAAEVLRSSGRLHLQVTGWSMLPAIWPGDTLELERTKRDELSVGDIVLFCRNRRLFAHRVVNVDGEIIRTLGDAMRQVDPVTSEDELLGRVTCIVRDGKCILPKRHLSFSERIVADVVRSSELGARVVVGIHGLLQSKVSSS